MGIHKLDSAYMRVSLQMGNPNYSTMNSDSKCFFQLMSEVLLSQTLSFLGQFLEIYACGSGSSHKI